MLVSPVCNGGCIETDFITILTQYHYIEAVVHESLNDKVYSIGDCYIGSHQLTSRINIDYIIILTAVPNRKHLPICEYLISQIPCPVKRLLWDSVKSICKKLCRYKAMWVCRYSSKFDLWLELPTDLNLKYIF